MIFAIDFDGTVVKHKYPDIGESIGAEPVLRNLVKNGHKIILFTMRSSGLLEDAVNWFKERDIELWGVNANPMQHEWTTSPKPLAHYYIDDHGIGCPLTKDKEGNVYVDWKVLDELFKKTGIIDTVII